MMSFIRRYVKFEVVEMDSQKEKQKNRSSRNLNAGGHILSKKKKRLE